MDEKNTEKQKEEKLVITDELVSEFKGRIPKAISKDVVEYKKNKRLDEAKKVRLLKEKNNTIEQKKRIDLFLEEFLKNGGNATRAALHVFNCSSAQSAAVLGHKYLKQAKLMGRVYLEKRGYGYGKLLDVAAKKMEESKSPEWWDRIMKLAEYEDFMEKKSGPPVAVNVFQAHKSLVSDYIEDAEEVTDIGELSENLEEEIKEKEKEKDDTRLKIPVKDPGTGEPLKEL